MVGSGGQPKRERIADDIRRQILDGSLVPGSKLPTEVEITASYEVARQTARDALGVLVNEGLIESRRPIGYFVRSRRRMDYRPQSDLKLPPPEALQDSFLTEQSLQGRQPAQEIDVSIVAPHPEIAKRLNLGSGELAVVRRRIRYLDGEPFYSNDSYFPLDIAQGTAIMVPHDIALGANSTLVEHGYVQTRAVDEIFVRMPRPEEAVRLGLTPGTPVAIHLTTGFTAEGKAVRCVHNVLPGDKHVIIYERDGLPANAAVAAASS